MANIDSHSTSNVNDCKIITLKRVALPEAGNYSAVQNTPPLPFNVRRIFYLYDLPADAERGGHSHHVEQELIVAVAGSFDVTVDDGKQRRTFHLDRPYHALHVTAGIWRTIGNFSSGSVCLVLSSTTFDEADYVRDYDVFTQLTASK